MNENKNVKAFRFDSLTSFVEDMEAKDIRRLLIIGKQLEDMLARKGMKFVDADEEVFMCKSNEMEYKGFILVPEGYLNEAKSNLQWLFNFFKENASKLAPVSEFDITEIESIKKEWKLK